MDDNITLNNFELSQLYEEDNLYEGNIEDNNDLSLNETNTNLNDYETITINKNKGINKNNNNNDDYFTETITIKPKKHFKTDSNGELRLTIEELDEYLETLD